MFFNKFTIFLDFHGAKSHGVLTLVSSINSVLSDVCGVLFSFYVGMLELFQGWIEIFFYKISGK